MIFLVSCGPSSAYRKFVRHGSAYYATVAKECDELLSRGPHTGLDVGRALALDLKSLPPEVAKLHPQYIFVDTNGVAIHIGEGLESFAITWGPNSNGESWRLSVYTEGHNHVLYTGFHRPR